MFDEAQAHAIELAEKDGLTYIPPFNDETVATGQGTIAMEVIQELPLVDTILVPVGGGGLACGVSTFAKLYNPKIRVIGVEPEGAPSLTRALEAGHPTKLDGANTIADGTAVLEVGDKVFPYLQSNLDDVVTVPDDELIGVVDNVTYVILGYYDEDDEDAPSVLGFGFKGVAVSVAYSAVMLLVALAASNIFAVPAITAGSHALYDVLAAGTAGLKVAAATVVLGFASAPAYLLTLRRRDDAGLDVVDNVTYVILGYRWGPWRQRREGRSAPARTRADAP